MFTLRIPTITVSKCFPPDERFQVVQDGDPSPIPVTVVGPLFLDKVHGQEGVARNGAEIHPVLRVKRRAGGCP
jgi:hypothetical protein